jgi:cytochrome c oxidase cbb3-type subunit IV
METSLLNSLSTVVMFVAFAVIVVWAWSSKRRSSFDEAARIPLEDDAAEARAQKNTRE